MSLKSKVKTLIRLQLWIAAIYCLVFFLWTAPTYFRDIYKYSKYLHAEQDDICQGYSFCEVFCKKDKYFIRLPDGRKRLDYSSWYNLSKQHKFYLLQLKGKDESIVQNVFGPASEIDPDRGGATTRVGSDGKTELVSYFPPHKSGRTYNYFPYPFVFLEKFQLHCWENRIQSFEIFD